MGCELRGEELNPSLDDHNGDDWDSADVPDGFHVDVRAGIR